MVAMGTLRPGFSTTAAATDALSSPVKAQNTSTRELGTAVITGSWRMFHEALNSAGSKYHQPAVAISRIGIRPSTIATDSIWHTSRGPRIFTRVSSQIRPTLAAAPCAGRVRAGMKLAR